MFTGRTDRLAAASPRGITNSFRSTITVTGSLAPANQGSPRALRFGAQTARPHGLVAVFGLDARQLALGRLTTHFYRKTTPQAGRRAA